VLKVERGEKMVRVHEKVKELVRHRWVVFVCAMWDMSFAGTSYMFGSISPVIKSSMGFNQKQVAFLSVAKDLGDNVGLLAGKFSQLYPISSLILVGVFQNVLGYGLVWLVVTHRLPALPLWLVGSLPYSHANILQTSGWKYNTECKF